jgi:diguanylate cyclase (GGDEF)-like protein/PAS domain S-box-containing protein
LVRSFVRHLGVFMRNAAEPILVFVLTAILKPLGFGGESPLWQLLIVVVLGSIFQQPAFHRWMTGNDLSRYLTPRVAGHLMIVASAMYLTGWGPLLAIAFLNVVSLHINWSGARAWRAGAIGCALGIVAGQVAVAVGLVKLYLPSPQVHGAALFVLLASVSACRILGDAVQRDAGEVITLAAADGTVTYVSPSCAAVLGREPESLTGDQLSEFIHPADAPTLVEPYRSMVNGGRDASYEQEVRIRHADGTWRWFSVTQRNLLENEAVAGIVGHLRDVTEKHAAQEQIAYAASHDALTDLLNPSSFVRHVETALYDANGEGALLFLDLDGFKKVNDTLGHHTGDMLLQAIAEVLREMTMGRDVIGRLGGDEFGVLLTGIGRPNDAESVARRIISEIDREVAVGGQVVHVGCSIGIAMATPGVEAKDLMSHADGAMYVSKRRGRNGFEVAAQAV